MSVFTTQLIVHYEGDEVVIDIKEAIEDDYQSIE